MHLRGISGRDHRNTGPRAEHADILKTKMARACGLIFEPDANPDDPHRQAMGDWPVADGLVGNVVQRKSCSGQQIERPPLGPCQSKRRQYRFFRSTAPALT